MMHKEFSTRRGNIRKDLLRPDGLHLSRQGNDKLAGIIIRLIDSKIRAITTVKTKHWLRTYDRNTMSFGARLGR